MRVRRFWFVFWGGCRGGCCPRCRLMSVWVKRFLLGAVGQGVVGSVWCLYGWGLADFHSFLGGCRPGCCRPRHPWNYYKLFIQFLFYVLYIYIIIIYTVFVFTFVSCLWISIFLEITRNWNLYILNPFNKLRKWLIPFHAIWGLCWYNCTYCTVTTLLSITSVVVMTNPAFDFSWCSCIQDILILITQFFHVFPSCLL